VTLSVNAGVIYLAAIMQPFENHEKVIRIIATGLQAIGWIAVFYGVLKTRKQFGMPSVWRNLNDWWKQRPKIFPKPVHAHANATLDGVSVSATGSVGVPELSSNALLERKVELLTLEVQQLKAAHQAIRKEYKEGMSDLRLQVESHKASSSQSIQTLKETLTMHATGGIDLTLSGSVFFFVGTVLGTLPYDVIRLPCNAVLSAISSCTA
jgi:hypothetical protein